MTFTLIKSFKCESEVKSALISDRTESSSPRIKLMDEALEADHGEESGAESTHTRQEKDGERQQRLTSSRLR